MSNAWPTVTLRDVLHLTIDAVTVDPAISYPIAGVYSFARGLFARVPISGTETTYKTLHRLHRNDFVLSQLKGWEGAIACIPDEFDGWFLSPQFQTFRAESDLLDIAYLEWYCKQAKVWEELKNRSRGMGARRDSVSPTQFLSLAIPLPPLEEQQRIVARIEELAAKIEEARGLRREAVGEVEKILTEVEFRMWTDESLEKAPCLDEITTFLSRGRQSEQGESKHYLIKTQHVQQGNYVRSHITLAPEIATKVLPDAMVRPGDILIACSAAGCLGRVARFMETDQVASVDTHVAIARANPQLILPEYLYAYLRGGQGQVQLRSRERGDWMREKVGFRLTELNLADLKRVPVPLPSLSEQQRIVTYLNSLQSRVDALKQMQAKTSAELDALLPSILDKAFKGEL